MSKRVSKRVAVVDIGSNSVRLVIYRIAKSGHDVVHEKKATCKLARDMLHDAPKLNRKGVVKALKSLRKFRELIDKHGAKDVIAIGTAAMRAVEKTKDGRAFHRKAQAALGHKIKIISGRMEARLTAYGVMSVLPDASGVCGDLGGGSLELASVSRGHVRHTVTLPLGSLTLVSESGGDPIRAEHIMHARLNHVPWLGHMRGRTFYPIGGSWRAIARIVMKERHTKMRKVHGYAIGPRLLKCYAEKIARQKPSKFRKMHKKIRQRADVIPYAAAVLAEIIVRMKPGRIVFSGHGVREGLLHHALR